MSKDDPKKIFKGLGLNPLSVDIANYKATELTTNASIFRRMAEKFLKPDHLEGIVAHKGQITLVIDDPKYFKNNFASELTLLGAGTEIQKLGAAAAERIKALIGFGSKRYLVRLEDTVDFCIPSANIVDIDKYEKVLNGELPHDIDTCFTQLLRECITYDSSLELGVGDFVEVVFNNTKTFDDGVITKKIFNAVQNSGNSDENAPSANQGNKDLANAPKPSKSFKGPPVPPKELPQFTGDRNAVFNIDNITTEDVRQIFLNSVQNSNAGTKAIVGGNNVKRKIELYWPLLKKYMKQYGVNTPSKVSALLGQLGTESGYFQLITEQPSIYNKDMSNPSDPVGSKYEGRCTGENGLGNCQPGDGVKYKGRGLIGITGRGNYTDQAKLTGLPLVEKPELLEQSPDAAAKTAVLFLVKRTPFEQTTTDWDIHTLSRRVNGGWLGLNERVEISDAAIRHIMEKHPPTANNTKPPASDTKKTAEQQKRDSALPPQGIITVTPPM